jgi:RNA polymerase sigma-70 factor (ECF subfamily)
MSVEYVASVLPVIGVGDPVERLASLFDDHYDRLYRLARRLAPSIDDALDLVQETFLKAARFPKSIPYGSGNEEAWLVRVLVNIRRDQWRKNMVRDRHDKRGFGGSPLVSDGQHPEAALIARSALWQALNVLPPRRRAIVVMYELEGVTVPVIASLFGISPITVRWHLSMGRHDLNHALKAYTGGTHEES